MSARMTLLLKAQPLVDQRIPVLQRICQDFKAKGITPKLVVVLVGSHPASLLYITNKKKMCEKVGANFELRQLSPETSAAAFQAEMAAINADASIHGCIIQLPVFGPSKTLPIEAQVHPAKDVDGFHPQNTSQLYLGKVTASSLLPCTPRGIMALLEHYQLSVKGKDVVVIGRSQIVGKPLSLLMNLAGATVTMCHSGTLDLAKHTRRADIVVSAVGKVNLLSADHFDPARQTVVVDVGMSKNDAGLTVGDVDFQAVSPLVKAITPVPGGVGPMTVLSLIENLMTAVKNQKDRS